MKQHYASVPIDFAHGLSRLGQRKVLILRRSKLLS